MNDRPHVVRVVMGTGNRQGRDLLEAGKILGVRIEDVLIADVGLEQLLLELLEQR